LDLEAGWLDVGWVSRAGLEERALGRGDQPFESRELDKVLEELSGPKLLVLANEWLLELIKSPKVDVPDKALRSAPPRKLVSGKPPRLFGLAWPSKAWLSRLLAPAPFNPKALALLGLTLLPCGSVANDGCIIRSKNTENCGPDTGLLELVSWALEFPPRSCESLKGVVLALRELMELKLMVLV